MSKILIGIIRLYQISLSPMLVGLLGPRCRFSPSCSQYAIEAVRKHGPVYGSWLAMHRVVRCQPFCEGGHDPVP